MVFAQGVHDYMRPRPPVEYVSEDVEGVDGETLYEVAHRHDELVCPAYVDDGADDDVYVRLLVRAGAALVQQLLYDV